MKLPTHDKTFRFLLITIVAVMSLEALSFMSICIPMPYAPFAYAAVILGVGHSVVRKGLSALVHFRFGSINLLMTLAAIGAFYLGDYPEAAVVIALYVLGERLEDIGIQNSKSALKDLVNKTPKTAWLRSSNALVNVEHVAIGDVISIRPGDTIPLDGVIRNGETTVNEATITGEAIPKDKGIADMVYAGTLNGNSAIDVETTRSASDTTLARIIRLTYEASENKSNTQKFIQRFSRIYTPSVIVLSCLVWAFPVIILQQNSDHWLFQALTILVIACPCALVISTPVAIYAALANASAHGILVKGGKFLEAMAGIKVVAMDKTRTITKGEPIVSDIVPLGETSREELLSCVTGTELFSTHPLAQAIVAATQREGIIPHNVAEYTELPGKGASAQCLVCSDKAILLGKLSFIREKHSVSDEVVKVVDRLSKEGKTCVVVSFRAQVVGVIGLSDEIKTESGPAISELQRLGRTTVMLSGDSSQSAQYVAAQVGIEKVYSQLLPDEKAEIVAQIQGEVGPVAMVGDGINDAPALAISTVGIAMASVGSDAAIEAADIALMNDKLVLIPFLVRLSHATLRKIRLNTALAISIKVLFIVMAFFGLGSLILAITADVGVTLVVILNSLRLLRFE